ncbi:MAG TPA: YrzE family protein [Bryobacteraceae bacterium]|nr:YrzE family protein [Bryobacteraceae bacterium]
MRERRFFLLPLLVSMVASLPAQRESGQAVKLDLKVEGKRFTRIAPVTFTVSLLDINNRPAKTAVHTPIQISLRTSPKDAVQLTTVTVRRGQSSVSGRLSGLPLGGVVYLWAKSPGLLAGGVSLKVRGGAPISKPAPSLPPLQAEPGPPGELPLIPVALSFSPQRDFWANGKDPVTLSAFYMGPGAGSPSEIKLRFADGTGTLNPNPLVIPPGGDEGHAKLTFDHAGPVEVKFLRADPQVALEGGSGFRFNFVPPPVTQLRVSVSPPAITLAETASVIVELLDDDRRPAASATDTPVTLRIEQGRGSLAQTVISIPRGKSSAQTEFRPVWRGATAIAVSAAGLDSQAGAVTVTLPVVLMLLSALGGLAGGFLAALPRQRSRKGWWRDPKVPIRLVVGMLTGFFLYWAASLGLVSLVPRTVLMNPISAVVVAMIGGWLGTGVFSLIIKKPDEAKP